MPTVVTAIGVAAVGAAATADATSPGSDRPMELGEAARRRGSRDRLSDASCKSDLSDVSIDSSFFEQQSSMGSENEQDLSGFEDELNA